MMQIKNSFTFILGFFVLGLFIVACGEREDDTVVDEPLGSTSDFERLLSNQVESVIIPTMISYQSALVSLERDAVAFQSSMTEETLATLRQSFKNAYLAYQAAAVHDYYATANQALVITTNLYPIEIEVLSALIADRSYDFNTTSQQRANGFPAAEFMLYGNENNLAYFESDLHRIDFLVALLGSMRAKADILVTQWSGELKENFIANGGTALGSSISVQLNNHISYYEEHVRENKVGIPIGLLGPNDDPIAPDAAKIEALYISKAEGNENFALQLLRSAVEEMEDLYLGMGPNGSNNTGYDDLVLNFSESSLDQDIKAQFDLIYEVLDSRAAITGDDTLYNAIQGIVTLYKSDLFPVLNIQDADGANDGD